MLPITSLLIAAAAGSTSHLQSMQLGLLLRGTMLAAARPAHFAFAVLARQAWHPPAAGQPPAAALCTSSVLASAAAGWRPTAASSGVRLARGCAATFSSSAGQRAPRNPLDPPIEPDPLECCGRGCVGCVWTVYFEELKEHQAALAAAAGEAPPEDPFEALERKLAQQAAAIAAMPEPQEQAAAAERQEIAAAASVWQEQQQQQPQQRPQQQEFGGRQPPGLAAGGLHQHMAVAAS